MSTTINDPFAEILANPSRMAEMMNGGTEAAPAQAGPVDPFADYLRGGINAIPSGQAVGPQSFTDFFTGSQRTEFPNAPEYGSRGSVAEGIGSTLRQMTITEPEQWVGIIRRQHPDALFQRDRFGNLMVRVTPDAQPEYLNMPGLSGADIARAVPEVGAALLTRGRSLLPRMLSAAGLAGTTSVALDTAAVAQGSDQGIDAGRAATSALLGGIGEGVGSALGRVATSWINSVRGRGNLIDAQGNLTTTGREVFRQASIDPSTLSREQIEQIQTAVRGIPEGQRAEAARTLAGQARSREFGVPMTPGQQTGDIGTEARLRSGAAGQPARDTLAGFDQRQGAAIGANRERMQMEASGATRALPDEEAAGVAIGEELARARTAGQTRVDQAYDAVGNLAVSSGAGRQLEFEPRATELFRQRIGSALIDRNLDPQLTPGALSVLRQVDELMPTDRPVSLGQLDTLRRRMLMTTGANPSDTAAIATMREQLDGWAADMVTAGLARGDEAAFETYRRAIQTAREFNQFFNPRNAPQRVQNMVEFAARENYSGQELFNAIFGSGRIGTTQGTVAAMQHLGMMFAPDSPIFGALREGALLRIMGRDAPTTPAQIRAIARNLDEALEGRGRAVIEGLFTPEQIGELRRFGSLLNQIAENSPGSGLAGAYRAGFGDLAGRVGAAGVAEAIGRASGVPGVGTAAGLLAGGILGDSFAARQAARVTSGATVPLPLYQTPVSRLISMSLAAGRPTAATEAEPTLWRGIQQGSQTATDGLFGLMDRR